MADPVLSRYTVMATCAHCGARFTPTESQLEHYKYDGRIPYCSPTCRMVATFVTPRPLTQYGPCPTCGQMFGSKREKRFCSMRCYTKSPQFRAMVHVNCRKHTPTQDRETRSCLECGAEFQVIRSSPKKYCSTLHYREYMAKRFDRWIANPQTFALPQAYDEFLSSEELPCLIDGCAWRGSWLTMHMNFTHGIRAEEFKRAAGFNASSGIIAAPLQKILSETRPPGNPHVFDEYRMAGSGPRNVSYFSNEAREHHQKGRALANLTFQAIGRTCLRCGKAFQQTSAMGLKKFCTITCRTQHYQEGDRQLLYPLVCATCGEEFLGNRLQRNNDVKGKPVCCTVTCKMRLNGSRPKPKHPKIESLNAS